MDSTTLAAVLANHSEWGDPLLLRAQEAARAANAEEEFARLEGFVREASESLEIEIDAELVSAVALRLRSEAVLILRAVARRRSS